MCFPSHWYWTLQTIVLLRIPSLVRTLHNVVLLCVPSLDRTFQNGVLMSVPFRCCRSWQTLVFKSSPPHDGRSWKTLVLMSFPSFGGRSFRSLVFESIPWLLFPGSGAVRFIFLPGISCFIFDAWPWWNECVPMPFVLLLGIYTFAQVDAGFVDFVWAGRGGSGVGIPLGLYCGTLFLGRHTRLSPWQFLQFSWSHFCAGLDDGFLSILWLVAHVLHFI